MPTGSWDPMAGKEGVNATRAIFNSNDRAKFNVVYHDPTKTGGFSNDYSMANYRPAINKAS